MGKEAFTDFIIIETKKGAIDLIKQLKVAATGQGDLSILSMKRDAPVSCSRHVDNFGSHRGEDFDRRIKRVGTSIETSSTCASEAESSDFIIVDRDEIPLGLTPRDGRPRPAIQARLKTLPTSEEALLCRHDGDHGIKKNLGRRTRRPEDSPASSSAPLSLLVVATPPRLGLHH
jgi:hypothetical protein